MLVDREPSATSALGDAESAAQPFAALARKAVGKVAGSSPAQPPVTVAVFSGFDKEGRVLVSVTDAGSSRVLAAQTTVALTPNSIGRRLVVGFEDGDPGRPMVLGVLRDSVASTPESTSEASGWSIDADGERLVITAAHEIVLRCGEASITLTQAGKVLIRGTYVLSRSTGNNKIKGATVDIN
jgi:hypothetical protein